MAVLFESLSFFLLDHGSALVVPSSLDSRVQSAPISGLFYQPKQYFKTKQVSQEYHIRNLFQNIGYTGLDHPDRHAQHPQKRRKVSSRRCWDWTSAGFVPPHKNSNFAANCQTFRESNVLPFPVVINRALSAAKDDREAVCEITIKNQSLFNKYTCNTSEKIIYIKSDGKSYLLPPNSCFLMSDIVHLNTLLSFSHPSGYHFIVLDPPWSNKSIKRSGHYRTLSSQTPNSHKLVHNQRRKYEEVGYMFDKMNIPELLSENGVLGMWITNNRSHVEHCLNDVFPKWGLRLAKVCFWLKVTNNGDPIVPFNSPHKKPYELLFIGMRSPHCTAFSHSEIDNLLSFPFHLLQFPENTANPNDSTNENTDNPNDLTNENTGNHNDSTNKNTDSLKDSTDEYTGNHNDSTNENTDSLNDSTNEDKRTNYTSLHGEEMIEKVVISSIPSVQHSRKPPLGHIYPKLRAANPDAISGKAEANFLELFARSLNPGWVSWGNEVLLFQDSDYFRADIKSDNSSNE